MPPLYSYTALNALASDDTGHFVYLSAWQYVACMSILEQGSPLYFWMNDQYPLTTSEQDDLEAKLAEVQNQLMSALTGFIMPICTTDIPPGTLLCDGSTYARTDYPLLYAALDTAYIVDSDTFVTPDLRDRFVMGAGPDHLAAAAGGSFSHTQIISEMANHSHSTDPHSHTEITAVPSLGAAIVGVPVPSAIPGAGVTSLATVTVHDTGGGDPMDITNAYFALRYIVVAS